MFTSTSGSPSAIPGRSACGSCLPSALPELGRAWRRLRCGGHLPLRLIRAAPLLNEHWRSKADWEAHRDRRVYKEIYAPQVLPLVTRAAHLPARQ